MYKLKESLTIIKIESSMLGCWIEVSPKENCEL